MADLDEPIEEIQLDENISTATADPPSLPVLNVSADQSSPETHSAHAQNGLEEGQGSLVPRETPQTIPGLNEMLNEWQISGIPEEQTFFSTEHNLLDAAVNAVKARLNEEDSNIQKSWLLTEIDHWDLEKERILLLTDKSLISVKFNFITQMVEEYKTIPLISIREVIVGDFKYTHSYAHVRKGKGMKIVWGEEPVGFWTKWNPISSVVPYTIFTSHVLVMRNRIQDERMTIENVISSVEQAINDCQQRAVAAQQASSSEATPSIPEFNITQGEIIFDYYIGLSALVHNQSFLGFFKKRGAINW